MGNTRKTEIDVRSFIEIWYSLPELGHRIIEEAMDRRHVLKKSVHDWVDGGIPRLRNAEKLQKVLKDKLGINTKVITLFPTKPERMALVAKYRKTWDGTIDWPVGDDEEIVQED